MDVRKLRGPLLRVHYNFLRLIAAIEDVLATDQEMGLTCRLTGAATRSIDYRIIKVGNLKIAQRRTLAAFG